jgi:alpha-glucosidase (family GH31 glycosyl hydrolase)
MPLYVRSGAILPLGPVKQYVDEKADEPLAVTIYPGADASFILYEDDGESFNYRRGEWLGIEMSWNDTGRMLRMKLASGSKMLPPLRRAIEVAVADKRRQVEFAGHPIEVRF